MSRQLSLFLAALALCADALALDIVPYQAEAFEQAVAAGKVSAIQFHSGWCPVCVMQERGLRALQQDPALAQVVVFRADFMSEEALRKRHAVHSFSTLVVFRGREERARTTGDFQPEQLKLLFAKAL